MKKLVSIAVLFFISFCLFGQCYQDWKYKIPITIINDKNDSDLTNFQVQIDLEMNKSGIYSKMQPNAQDIRFTDSGSCNPINFWIDKGSFTNNMTIWIKTSVMAKSRKCIYMYYGNSNASSISNGDSTFLLFDDFDGKILNTNKWTFYGKGVYGINGSGGIGLVTKSISSPDAVLKSNLAFMPPIKAEINVWWASSSWISLALLNSNTWYGYNMLTKSNEMFNAPTETDPTVKSYYSTKYLQNASLGDTVGIWQFAWVDTFQHIKWPGGSIIGHSNDVKLGNAINIAFGKNAYPSGSTFYHVGVDWARVRKYTAIEPTFWQGKERHNEGIKVAKVSNSNLCPGNSFKVDYDSLGIPVYNNGNKFTIYLSDSAGSFSSPTAIGNITTTTPLGTINAKLPNTLKASEHYRLRVDSDDPQITGRTSTMSLVVASLPKAAFNASANSICAGEKISFSNVSQPENGVKYFWDFGDGKNDTLKNPEFEYTVPGTYNVKLVVTNSAGCQDSMTKSITVYEKPKASFTVNNAKQCIRGNKFSFTNTSTLSTGTLSYNWDFGDSKSSSAQNPDKVYDSAGTYKVVLTTKSDKVCSDTYSLIVNVIAQPKADISYDRSLTFCSGDSVKLSTTPHPLHQYKWMKDGIIQTGEVKDINTAKKAGKYQVIQFNADGCTDTSSELSVIVNPAPAIFTINGLRSLCEGDTITLSVNPVSGLSYTWKKDGNSISGATTNVKVTSGGLYTAIASNSNNCSTSSVALVTVNPLPTVPTITRQDSILTSSPAVGYQWYFNSSKLIGATNQTYIFKITGDYSVEITDGNGCKSRSGVYKVTGIEKISDDNIKIYPNPTTEILTIDLSKSAGKYETLVIIDASGKKVITENIGGKKQLQVSFKGLAKGVYTVKIGEVVERVVYQ